MAGLVALLLAPCAALADGAKLPIDQSPGRPYDPSYTVQDMVYDDPTIHVERFRVQNSQTRFNCHYHYCTITIADASQLRTAAAQLFPNEGRAYVRDMARAYHAVVAVNGDFYGGHRDGFVLRQGVVYRDRMERKQDILLIDEEGDFHIIPYDADLEGLDKTQWEGRKIINALTFGPALIVNDEKVFTREADPAYADAQNRGERTAIVQTGHLSYMVLTCREVGCSLEEMAELIQELCGHVECAYLLDGGLSSQLVYLGGLVNKVAAKAVPVTDMVYFASAWDPHAEDDAASEAVIRVRGN